MTTAKAEIPTAEVLTAELAQFSGSEQWYRHFLGLIFTEGIHYLAETAGAYWLIDLAASYQPKWAKKAPFQVWRLEVDVEHTKGVITMREDTDTPVLVRQVIGFTDFPLPVFEFYVTVDERVTMLLKDEY